ncbi:hypothetical protein [Arthrobacter sp. NPDC056493]|uniref:hypothetical protein n=1 Tax=Arthrobacter sp. NPDC056493 TaxID=3345839 RepID=UPI00366D716C
MTDLSDTANAHALEKIHSIQEVRRTAFLSGCRHFLLLVICENTVMVATRVKAAANVGQNLSLNVPIVSARNPLMTRAAMTRLANMSRICRLLNGTLHLVALTVRLFQ